MSLIVGNCSNKLPNPNATKLIATSKPSRIPARNPKPCLKPKLAPTPARASGAGPGEPNKSAVVSARVVTASIIFHSFSLHFSSHTGVGCAQLLHHIAHYAQKRLRLPPTYDLKIIGSISCLKRPLKKALSGLGSITTHEQFA